MPDFSSWGSMPLFKNSLTSWLIALSISAGLFCVLLLVRSLIRRYHRRLSATDHTEILEIPAKVLGSITVLFLVLVSMYAGFLSLESGDKTRRIVTSIITIAAFWQVGALAVAAAGAWIAIKRRDSMESNRAAAGSLGIISFIVSVVIWSMVLMLTLDNLGVDITALVAGLGIGGIAVALAVQNVLGDLFASLSIALDRPFVIGDFLIVGDYMGSVEYIGIKSTRLRSLSGEQIIMSNSDLLSSRVRNYGRMQERRVVFAIGVVYETPYEHIEKIPGIIQAIVKEQPDTRFDRSHFQKYGDWSLDFETVYYVLSADYTRYMNTQQAINLRLHREFSKLGIQFAFPTRTVIYRAEQGAGDETPPPTRADSR